MTGSGRPDDTPSDDTHPERHLLPEEEQAGSDDAQRQAEVILEDSEARTEDPEQARLESSQTPDPADS